MKTVVFSDRDGTINKDENYYLGSSPNWKDQVSILEGVVQGIKLINTIPESYFFILTNQSGVALQGGEFDNLTVGRMTVVNQYIVNKLTEAGCKVDDFFACPFVDKQYAKNAAEKGRRVDPEFIVDNHPNLKPNIGMIKNALFSIDAKKEDCNIYVIGDRASDVKMAIKAGGIGVLVESLKTKELGDKEKVLSLGKDVYVAKDFFDAARIVANHVYSKTL